LDLSLHHYKGEDFQPPNHFQKKFVDEMDEEVSNHHHHHQQKNRLRPDIIVIEHHQLHIITTRGITIKRGINIDI
jgi:hypothetical protein